MKLLQLVPVIFLVLSACNIASPPKSETNPTTLPQSPNATVLPVSQSGGNAGIIFHNGVVLTMNRDQPAAEAILIQGDTIQAVGTNTEILTLRGTGTVVIDLGGLTLMPGFVDDRIKMRRYGETQVVFFGDEPRVQGFSMTQLIETSLVSAHFANASRAIYLDVFSCAPYDPQDAAKFAADYFKADHYQVNSVNRR